MLALRLPSPYPGELVGSVLSRAVIHTGLPTKRLLQKIAGRTRSNYSFFLPSQLNRLAHLMRMDAHRLLWEHTAFPYLVAFMSPGDVARFESKVIAEQECVGSLSTLIQSVTKGLPALRYCPQCVHDDIVELGESYWHREHCLPATHWCLRHDIALFRSSIGARLASRAYSMGLPQHQRGEPDEVGLREETARMLATANRELLERRAGDERATFSVYRNLSLSRGFQMTGGDVAGAQMATDLAAFFDDDYLTQLGCPVHEARRPWPALMVRDWLTVPFTPVKHILLRSFLEQSDACPKKLSYRPPGKRPRSMSTLDAQLAMKIQKAAIRANIRNVQTTATKLLAAAGHWSAFRHDRSQFPLTVAELNAFKQTEASEHKLGGRTAHRLRMERRLAADCK